jgi:phosphate transport system substrate-binding protein
VRLCCRLALLFALLFVLAGCTPPGALNAPRPVTIAIAGSTAMQPALNQLTTEFSRQHPHIIFQVRGGGSTLGEERAFAGKVQLGASTLRATDSTHSLVRIPIGMDGLAIVVHPGNQIESLSSDVLRSIFSGRILDWEEIGGPAGEIVLVSREDGSGARRIFEDRIMQNETVSLTAVVMPTSRDVLEYVAENPNAIGYLSRAYTLSGSNGAGSAGIPPSPLIHVVALDGIAPTRMTLRSQEYPLVQPLYLVSRGEPSGWTRQFVDFVLSPAGQTIIRRYHVPIR